MSAVTITAAAVRAVAGDAEDVFDAAAASGYTPEVGDLVAISGSGEVDGADATVANGLQYAAGIVEDVKAAHGAGGGTTYRVTVRTRGIIEGFSSLTAGNRLFTSTTAEKFDNADATASGITAYPVALALTATKILLNCPVMG